MLELPETVTIARQMNAELGGRRIASSLCGASPHKFAFFNHPPEFYPSILDGRMVESVNDDGRGIISVQLDSGWVLLFREIAGRIQFHQSESTLPSKHQLLLAFEGGAALTVTLAMWGAVQAMPCEERDRKVSPKIPPLSAAFTYEHFERLLADPAERETRSVKAFMISKPGIAGLGNGCLQDLLFQARLHPRRRMVTLKPEEQLALYQATRATLHRMVDQGGRDSERDLYNRPGGYPCILSSRTSGAPCPRCGARIEKIQYLGGASYFCPACQL